MKELVSSTAVSLPGMWDHMPHFDLFCEIFTWKPLMKRLTLKLRLCNALHCYSMAAFFLLLLVSLSCIVCSRSLCPVLSHFMSPLPPFFCHKHAFFAPHQNPFFLFSTTVIFLCLPMENGRCCPWYQMDGKLLIMTINYCIWNVNLKVLEHINSRIPCSDHGCVAYPNSPQSFCTKTYWVTPCNIFTHAQTI